MLVPAATLAAFGKKCHRDGKVEIYAGGEFAAFSDGAYTLIMQQNAGEFPRGVHKFITGEAETWVTAEAPALAAAVARAGKLADRADPIRLDVARDGTGARIMVQAVTDGRVVSSQAVPCRFDGPDAHVGFNAAYLASVLNGVGGGRARLGFSGTAATPKPLQVRGTDGFAAVQMPIKIAG